MDIDFNRWYQAIGARYSQRSYEMSREIQEDKLAILDEVCRNFTPFPGARAQLIIKPQVDIYRGIIGNYGNKVNGAPAFIAFIGNTSSSSFQEATGYTGEGIILEATAMGLNTCWIGGFFRRERVNTVVDLKLDEKVLAVTPVGYSQGSERKISGFGHGRLPVSRLLRKAPEPLPEWVKLSLGAARVAPSASNRQPWGFDVDDDGIKVFVRSIGPDFNVSKRLDCGIAMLHIEAAARFSGIAGKWEFLEPPNVAKYVIK